MGTGRIRWCVTRLAALLFASSLVLLPSLTTAQVTEVGPGATVEVLADYGDPGIPGVSGVRLVRFILQPGAKIQNFEVKTTNFCTADRGTVTAVTAAGTTILGAGSRWVEPKGLVYKVLQNSGSEAFVDVFYEFTHR